MVLRNYNKTIKRLSLLVIAVLVLLSFQPVYDGVVTRVERLTSTDILLLDPGHGGMDGGAQSAAGVSEKDINLAIAMYVKEFAEADGWKVVMTREKDIALGDTGSKTIRGKKTADLIARKQMIKEVAPIAAISIHLNSFKQDRSVRGAQTFFPSGPGEQVVLDESKKLAEAIQDRLVTGIADGSERVALGKRDVLMFKNPTVPMAIVECGFLSNESEAKLLEDPEYQKKIARYIYEGIMIYSGKEPIERFETIDSRG
ncbi:hypothetical protein FRZ06_14545 [Anoxybacterium hadale]|uniref:Uncharacterized protein n=1 Tax=Anoxybacterium hadale TaxID=3408580 RepID=A0ACD1AD68_9FIRM|nr:hypothetical protein FRZ06_14545 [Clostridiales bacterium]